MTATKLIRNSLCMLFVLWVTMPMTSKGQYADEEYKMEWGARLGGSFYLGDANLSLFKDLGLSAGIIGRYNLNPRMVLKCDLGMVQIAGDTRTINNVFPENEEVSFERTIYDLGAQFEYNLWPYGWGLSVRESKRFTPYIMGGLGVTYATAPADDVATMHFSLGGGVKYKFAPRWNVGCEFAMRFTLSDKLDVPAKTGLILDDPYQIKGGFMKNKDSYSFIAIAVTYDLFPRCNNCNKD